MSERYRIRIDPRPLWECLTCGALVKDMTLHDEWHRT